MPDEAYAGPVAATPEARRFVRNESLELAKKSANKAQEKDRTAF